MCWIPKFVANIHLMNSLFPVHHLKFYATGKFSGVKSTMEDVNLLSKKYFMQPMYKTSEEQGKARQGNLISLNLNFKFNLNKEENIQEKNTHAPKDSEPLKISKPSFSLS